MCNRLFYFCSLDNPTLVKKRAEKNSYEVLHFTKTVSCVFVSGFSSGPCSSIMWSYKKPSGHKGTGISRLKPNFSVLFEHIFNAVLLILVSLIVLLMEMMNASINIIIRTVPLSLVLSVSPYRMDGDFLSDNIPSEAALGAISPWMFSL